MGILLLLQNPAPPVITPQAGLSLNDYAVALADRGYDWLTTPMTNHINTARRRIMGAYRWPFLEQEVAAGPLTVGDSIGDLSQIQSLLHIDAVRLEYGTAYVDLEHLPTQELRRQEHTDRENGEPRYWTRHGNALRFYPRPDKAYTVTADVVLYPGNLVQPTDLDTIPVIYQDVVIAGALRELTFRQRDWAGYDRAEQAFREQLQAMARAEGVLQRQTSDQVTSTGIWDEAAGP